MAAGFDFGYFKPARLTKTALWGAAGTRHRQLDCCHRWTVKAMDSLAETISSSAAIPGGSLMDRAIDWEVRAGARRPTRGEASNASADNRKKDDAQSLVFLIDDDASVREAVQRLLRSVGLDSEAFGSTREFIE